MYDILIRNGLIVDGTGRPAYRADVGVCGDRVSHIGELDSPAARILKADGCVVAPGFIDIHAHTDESVFANPTCESKVTQGVTTEVSGNCGESAAPRGGLQDQQDFEGWIAEHGIRPEWHSMGDFLAQLESCPMTVNFATYVGHGAVRSAAMGYADRRPTSDELAEMCRLVDEAMQAGALGISSGLIYPPGCYADTDELVELSRVAARYDGVYATHMRSERDKMIPAIEEAIRIGRESGARVQISHHKACGRKSWGTVTQSLSMIDEARSQGLDVMADQYPYTATSTGLGVMLPKWAHEGGTQMLLSRLEDPAARHAIREQLLRDSQVGWIADSGGWDTVVINFLKQERLRQYEGLSVTDIARRMEKHPVETVIDLLLEERGSVGIIHFVIDEADVKTVMAHPAVVIGSDATARSLTGKLSKGKPHPRSFGTFPRVLGRYCREETVLTVEEAVAKMTGRSAERLSLANRGVLAEGNFSDITIFDPDTVADTATFTHPHSVAAGIRYVLVNGQVVLDDGHVVKPFGHNSGRVLRRGIE